MFKLSISILIGLLISFNAFANDVAKSSFEKGKRLFDAKEYEDAASKFRAAYKAKESWKLLFNIAQAEAAANRYGLALEAFERYLSEGGDEIEPKRQDEILKEVKRLREMVGDVEVKGRKGLIVSIDSVERGKLPLSAPAVVSAGTEHWLIVTDSEGRTILNRSVRVRSGSKVVVEVDESTQVATKTEAPERKSALKPIGIATTITGGALLAAGLITGIAATAKSGDIDSACPDNRCTDMSYKDTIDSRKSLAKATDILLPVGAAIAATGVVLLLINKKRTKDIAVFPGLNGVLIEGRF